jgi:hypothetical protein
VNTDLVQLVDAIAGLQVIVIGEAMLNCYLTGFSTVRLVFCQWLVTIGRSNAPTST